MGRRALLKIEGISLPKSKVDGNNQKHGLSSQDFLDKSCRQFEIHWFNRQRRRSGAVACFPRLKECRCTHLTMPDTKLMRIFHSLRSISCRRTGFSIISPSIRRFPSIKPACLTWIVKASMSAETEKYTVNISASTPEILDQAHLSVERVSVHYH